MLTVKEFEAGLNAGLATAGVRSDAPLICAISGGPDSMALLSGLLSLRERYPEAVPPVVAAHFNHRLRGPESEGDARFVTDFCHERGVELAMGTGDVGQYSADRGLSLEAAARSLRYDFLSHVVADHSAQGVATGHTLDDQAETVLLHAVRGSGLRGIGGMRPRVDLGKRGHGQPVTIIRPMLNLRRRDTEAYCAEMGVRPRRDSSNTDVSIPRNLIRHRVMPELELINSETAPALARLAENAARDAAWLEAEAGRAWGAIAHRRGDGAISFQRGEFERADPAISTRLVQKAHAALAESGDDVEAVHILAVLDLLDTGTGAGLDLPGGVKVRIEYDSVLFLRAVPGDGGDDDCPFPRWSEAARLSVPGKAQLGDTHEVIASASELPESPAEEPRTVVFLDAGAIGDEFVVRPRRDGDTFQPLGMGGVKKIQDFFVDERVPRQWRDRVPLLDTPHGIAWVAGYRPAEWARVTSSTVNAVKIELLRRG